MEFTYRPEDKGSKELFSMVLYRPVARFLLLRFFKNTGITPNTVSVISLIFALCASFLFFLGEYRFLIVGAVFLNLAYVFDVLDGQLARYKGVASQFGRLFDAMLDVIKIVFLFLGISSGIYIKTHNLLTMVLAILALSNSLLTCYMMLAKRLFLSLDLFAVKVSEKVYVGYEAFLYVSLTFFALINNLYYGLVLLATLGSLSWIKIFIDACCTNMRNKST